MSAVPSARPRPLHFAAFVMNTTGHVIQGTWRRTLACQADFDDLEHWVRLARTLERGRFDAVFFADAVGHHSPSAIAYVTRHLGIAFTASILQEHPFNFARRISTLDHASKGRIASNIVADDPPNAWAEEYVDVTCKLCRRAPGGGDALRQDGRADSHAGDGKVHRINHRGPRYKVEGPHRWHRRRSAPRCVPGGRVQAEHRAFAARNAEAVFIRSPACRGRSRHRGHPFPRGEPRPPAAGHQVLPGPARLTGDTEAEARRKAAELDERTGDAAQLSPYTAASGRIVGTPEQIADELARWQDAGVDGVHMVNAGGPVPYEEFVDHVAPVLQERGLMQREYAEGTLRHKLFGRAAGLPGRHPAARYRGAFAPQHA